MLLLNGHWLNDSSITLLTISIRRRLRHTNTHDRPTTHCNTHSTRHTVGLTSHKHSLSKRMICLFLTNYDERLKLIMLFVFLLFFFLFSCFFRCSSQNVLIFIFTFMICCDEVQAKRSSVWTAPYNYLTTTECGNYVSRYILPNLSHIVRNTLAGTWKHATTATTTTTTTTTITTS